MSKFEELERVFTPDVKELLVNALMDAYDMSSDSYAPENGHDGMVYGLMVYKSATHFLNELSFKVDWLEILSRNPRFLMKIGDLIIATYKVGDSADFDLETAFPNNRVGAYQLAKANVDQLSLPFMEEEIKDDSRCTNLILAHAGNAHEGLTKVFVGVPIKFNEQQEITGWGTIYPIWDKGEGGVQKNERGSNGGSGVPEEQVTPPTITLKVAKKTQGN